MKLKELFSRKAKEAMKQVSGIQRCALLHFLLRFDVCNHGDHVERVSSYTSKSAVVVSMHITV